MAASNTQNRYEFDGTAALKRREVPELRVYDGAYTPRSTQTRRATVPSLSRTESLKVTAAIVAITLVLLFAGFLVDGIHSTAVESRISSMPEEQVYVYPGQTVWGIAEEHPIEGVSTQELASWIKQSNKLSTSSLVPGQTLLIPVVRR